ncbi:hypothetical protein JQS43_00735 [Natronosporangium hydrolyticum]|uniref:Uncharacterized protein n=1 Tax=Natronosporangium hydrolyticum TaxID=2811111 RepID=A0A895YK14_9ACTN|nr:hypothetical protein [Natronosporangium hydrolyticum]QSB14956.1 hypothetical protein JQS43_00735 [Natronosporangium hydrolyticum]
MRPSVPLGRLLPAGVLAAGLLVTGLLLAGCGEPPGLDDDAQPPPTAPPPPPPTPTGPGWDDLTPPPELPGSPGDGGFPDEIALGCDGRPGPAALIELLQAEGLLAASDDAEVVEGPFCSGTWQYAVIAVPDRDPLQVVTQGEPDALELVTAGTDVCTVEVRIQAPAGIAGAAAC